MGRRKLEIKRIEDKNKQQITFYKRRNGLMEKARQLSILCESSVAILIFSCTGKLYSSSSGDSMDKILKRYEIQHPDEQMEKRRFLEIEDERAMSLENSSGKNTPETLLLLK